MDEKKQLYKALKEVSVILDYTDPVLKAKVPKNFVWFMDNFKDETHYFNVDLRRPLKEQNLMYEAIVILSIILKSAWCDKKTLKRLEKIYKVPEETFMNDRREKNVEINNEIRSLKIIKKEGFVKKIVNGINKFLGLNRRRIYIPE